MRHHAEHSQEDWRKIENAEKAQQDIITRARAMMKAASIQYREAIRNSTQAELPNLTRNWSPKKILSVNKAFKALCAELDDVEVWNKLRGHERKFITEAYQMAK